MKRKFSLLITAAPLAAALAAAGYGASAATPPNSNGYGTPPTAKSAAATGRAMVSAARSPLGRILVDARGRTLYLFQKDRGTASTCYGACASIWPPLTTKGKPLAGPGVLASRLGTTMRKDGKVEVTYNRHPLYYYAGDTKRGQTAGQGLDQFGAEWYVLSAAGQKVEHR
jgi:predicted lipoprotein with Yx(FWY)xxD motif